MKQGDALPSLRVTLQDADGNAVDLTGAAVVFTMVPEQAPPGAEPIIDRRPCVIDDDATSGRVRYDWLPADTTTAGVFWGEFTATWEAGQESFPNDSYLTLRIVDQLA
jgi:hypothetical protein